MRRVDILRLFAKKFLINQSVERAITVLVAELVEGAPLDERLEADSVVPITLEDHVAVDGRDYTIHDVGAASERSQSQNQYP